MQESWLPTLRNLVSQINETFSRNFQEMAVAGEVSLGNYYGSLITIYCIWFIIKYHILIWWNVSFADEHDKDFDQFGILIKVKFRWLQF